MTRHRRPVLQKTRRAGARTSNSTHQLSGKGKGDRRQDRFDHGYSLGYVRGFQAGQERYGTPFDGTSIILPVYNQRNQLEQCLDSIFSNTDRPIEVIVVDDASTDDTLAYLQRLSGQIRYHSHETNRGLASAINTGLMMSKGSTICILNSDTLVTPKWLSGMLNCLHSNIEFGMVGSVSNRVDGEQQIPVPYEHVQDMYDFAAEYNIPDASRWHSTDRLFHVCRLMRRSTFEANGYFDERFENSGFADEDYHLRMRLLGLKLIVSRDVFIHRSFQASLQEQDGHTQSSQDKHAAFFQEKWGNAYDWLQRIRTQHGMLAGRQCQAFYPSQVAVTGLNDANYWIENGAKRPVQGELCIPIVRVSQLELRGWPTGVPIEAAAVAEKWSKQHATEGKIPDGAVFKTELGKYYRREGEACRELVSDHALNRWGFADKVAIRTEQERSNLTEQLPIMAHPVIHSYHI